MDSVLDEVRSVIGDVLDRGDGSWRALQESGLLALAAPEKLGGEGLGLTEISVLLHEVGRRAANLPVWETVACGLLPLVRSGSDDLQADLVPKVLAGELKFSPALGEPGVALPTTPTTTFDGTSVTGTKVGVPVLEGSTILLVSAGGVVALVDADGAGVSKVDTLTSRDTTEATYTFDAAPSLGELDAAVVRSHAIAGLAVLGAGVVEGARDLTAGYIKDRKQFGRSLAEFQAVAQQIADVYIGSRTFTLTATEVVRRLDAGDPADDDLAIAAYWFANRAPALMQICQHLHGGMGVDETYDMPRYFASVRDVARHLGGPAALADVPVNETAGKNAELTVEERAFKAEARDYLMNLVSDEDRDEMRNNRHGPAYHRIIKKMGADNWMGVGWPKEYGGQGRGVIEQQVFVNEASHADVHLPSVTLQTVGPTLQAYGTEKQKDMFLADIITGDVHFAIGYSEPDAGTDLASMRTSAKRDGDHYIVNGQKMWTTGGHAADWVWLAVRTDPDAPPHRGISVLIVDTKDPGYSWTPIVTSDGSHHTNATYFNDVRVPVDMLVGEENRGWSLITTQLNHERVMLGPAGRIEGLRDLVREWAEGRTAPDGTPVLEVPWVRDTLARATASFRVNELLNWAVANSPASDKTTVADASTSKVFASDEVQKLGMALTDVVDAFGDPSDPETGRLAEYLDKTAKRNLVLSFGGGVNEVQRELIAMFGLDLPRVPR
ncbi:alkylation response protein AidB-like acyl-CoA dehydrogenase [Aeromicrobium panaciterrae]|uniref:Alkylation response protein AidB-like acyl-CoA dehydrogenase n=1 Tax=Aeromicrobium panaciterrae TaxID=363861 RepID=A0ABU1UJN9_9ACTN|nr:acyl-CoA dehydrogenase [Aeromicrobium panaciterrae]MDR7085395.1 alkylation response protein AidB-like acyl-CoA dehydrogenase [Aeromicrobium panaciterrae]